MSFEKLNSTDLLLWQGDSILESIDTEVMEERMKILAQRARKGLGLLKNIVFIG